MNDRFKFRVWDDKVSKKYFYLELKFGDNGYHPDFITDPVFEQCTGLKDKNGNLIYIGDIIKCGDGLFSTATVEYANGENFIDGIYPFNLYHDCGDECHCQLRDYPEYACEIIGNIHEQAEQKDVK